jgi:hypothetical protein
MGLVGLRVGKCPKEVFSQNKTCPCAEPGVVIFALDQRPGGELIVPHPILAMSDFFARVGDAVRSLLQECKVMVSSVESRCGEGEMVENAKKAAASALAVGKLVSDHVGAIDESRRDATDLQQTFLLDYVGKLRESVVGLIRYSRHLHSNPVDFYTKQQLDNTLKAVVQHTKHVVEASRGSCPFAS